jgi:DNA-binding NtrC family response regulator
MNSISVLIIDDEKNLTRSLSFALKQANINSVSAHDGDSGLNLAEIEKPDTVLLDVRLGEESGLDILPRLKVILPDTPVIMMSAYGDTKDVVQAIKMGAVDYLTKPFDVDELLLLIQENVARNKLKTEVNYLREKTAFSEGLVGDSPALHQLSESIQRVSASTVKTVLLLGDTGVGKTLVAREIHNKTVGKNAPFVEINCASLPAELIEAELFGAEKGAYTGSTSKRVGLVEVADKGTLFLDEIGELPILLQSKLLTFLESWRYRPVGATREKSVDALVIMATNRDLKKLVDEKKFRDDLYFRINTMPIIIPSLTERKDDIGLLLDYFIQLYARREGTQGITLSHDVKTLLEQYRWPGNVRELKNLIERLTILYSGKKIVSQNLPAEMLNPIREVKDENIIQDTLSHTLVSNEREIILKALNECHWRKGVAAQQLGISRHALKRRIQKLGIE